jgi:Tol biopolymer transport system component/DNA-binding winged helix-turn-helix (wHTH) protein
MLESPHRKWEVDIRIIRFGVFEVDPATAELRKNGVTIKLQEQPFQILLRLLDRAGNIVTREELRNALWPEGTFVDFDHSLNASINRLRDALGDSASNPRFIQTLPKRGYRFIAPVDRPAMQPAEESTAAPQVEATSKRPVPKRLVAAVSIAMLISIGIGASALLYRSGTADPPVLVVPLTTAPGVEFEPSFSPDGNFVVYHGREATSKTASLYVKSVRSENLRRLTSGEASDKSPKWSPDGRSIAFVRFTPSASDRVTVPGMIMKTSAVGGPERAVPEGSLTVFPGWIYSLLDWFSDSEHVVAADYIEANRSASLFVVSTRTGLRHQIANAPAGIPGDMDPSVSPDGRRITFTRYTNEIQSDIWLLDLTSDRRPVGEPRPLVMGMGAKSAVWTLDGREIIFAAGPQHRKRLMRMRVEPGAAPRPLPFAAEGTFALAPAISRRNQIAYPLLRGGVHMYRSELGPDGTAIRTSRLALSSVLDHLPEFSPSGDRLAFVSNRSGVQEIWIAKPDGSDAYQLTNLQGKPEATFPRWSPDGGRLVFSGGGKAWIIDVQGGQPALLMDESNAYAVGAAVWSHDGKSLYIVSHRTGRPEIWKVPASGRHSAALDRQITRNGGGVPSLSPDGNFLYYADRNIPATLRRVPVEGGAEEVVIQQIAHNGAFTVAAAGVYFIPPLNDDQRTSVMLLDVRTGVQKQVAPVAGDPMWGMAVSPDGRTVLHLAMDFPECDLMLVENFR